MSWLKSTSILTPSNSPIDAQALFINTATQVFKTCGIVGSSSDFQPGIWHTLDLTPLGVPVDAVSVDLRGLLIITDNANSVVTALAVALQVPGGTLTLYKDTPLTPHYCMEVCAVLPSGGARSNASAIVPCVNGCIEWAWYRGNSQGSPLEWPEAPIASYASGGASYCVILDVHAIYMP